MPRVSPNKTWSGAIGGTLAAVDRRRAGGPRSVGIWPVGRRGRASCCRSSSQAGDLLESAIKRRFDAKDASSLIPGHGGLMDRLDGFVAAARAAAADRPRCTADSRRRRAVSWYGEAMPVSQSKSRPTRASHRRDRVVRSVTLLGATGSIGSSTVDLLKRGNGRYRVEAVTANRNAAALAQLARELRRAVCGGRRSGRLCRAQGRAGRLRHRGRRAGEAALIEAAERPADWVMAAISGSVGLKPTLAAAKRGATVALANKECLVCAGALFMRTAAAAGAQRAAGRFRAQRDLPGAQRRPPRGRQPDRADRLGRAVPHLDARGDARGHASSRRSSIPTGRWARRSPSIPRP